MRNLVNALGTPEFRELPVLFTSYQRALEFFMQYMSMTSLPLTELHMCSICDNYDPIFGRPENLLLANYPEDFVSETKKKEAIPSKKMVASTPLQPSSPKDLPAQTGLSGKQTTSQVLSLEAEKTQEKPVQEKEKQFADT